MLLISKQEKDFLVSRGWKWHTHIHKTHSAKPKYYATENNKLLNDLYAYRNRLTK